MSENVFMKVSIRNYLIVMIKSFMKYNTGEKRPESTPYVMIPMLCCKQHCIGPNVRWRHSPSSLFIGCSWLEMRNIEWRQSTCRLCNGCWWYGIQRGVRAFRGSIRCSLCQLSINGMSSSGPESDFVSQRKSKKRRLDSPVSEKLYVKHSVTVMIKL